MLITRNVPYIARRRSRSGGSIVPTLTLVAVGYEAGTYVRLQFDQDIDIGSFVPDQLTVSDGDTEYKYAGDTFSLIAPNTLEVNLMAFDSTADPGVKLWVTDGSGIVGQNGQSWAGVSALSIPWP
jgi:hypothetical protein